MTYKIQIDDVVRDALPKEIEAIEAALAETANEAKIQAEKAEAKSALLERLGITEDEAKLLFG